MTQMPSKVGQGDLVFGMWSGIINTTLYARKIASLCVQRVRFVLLLTSRQTDTETDNIWPAHVNNSLASWDKQTLNFLVLSPSHYTTGTHTFPPTFPICPDFLARPLSNCLTFLGFPGGWPLRSLKRFAREH